MQERHKLRGVVLPARIAQPVRLDSDVPLRLKHANRGLRGRRRERAPVREPVREIEQGEVEMVVVVRFLVVGEPVVEVAREGAMLPRVLDSLLLQVPAPARELFRILLETVRRGPAGQWGRGTRARGGAAERGGQPRWYWRDRELLAGRLDEGEEEVHPVRPGDETSDALLEVAYTSWGKSTIQDVLLE